MGKFYLQLTFKIKKKLFTLDRSSTGRAFTFDMFALVFRARIAFKVYSES